MLSVTEEELWKHRDEVKHKKPKNTPKQFEKSNHTPEELREMGHLQCNACGKFFHNDRMLRKHLYYAHRDLMPAPICAVCGTQFQTRKFVGLLLRFNFCTPYLSMNASIYKVAWRDFQFFRLRSQFRYQICVLRLIKRTENKVHTSYGNWAYVLYKSFWIFAIL